MATDKTRRQGCTLFVAYCIAALTALALLTCGCTRQVYVPVEKTTFHTDTIRQIAYRVDTVMVRDSVAVMAKGDTVWVTKYRDRFRYVNTADTVYKAVVDTARIEVPYPVERQLTKWQQAKMDIGGIAIGIIVVALCAAVVWLARKFR